MFATGLIIGLILGMTFSKVGKIVNSIDETTKNFANDMTETVRFYKWKRECRKNDI